MHSATCESVAPGADALWSLEPKNAARERLGRGPVLAAALGVLALAALLLPRAPGLGDSAELTLALALAGIAHPTGYPLYVLVGHLFVRAVHALGASWVVAANLWSAAGAAVAAGAYARLIQHLVAAFEDDERRAGRAAAHWLVKGTAAAFPVMLLALNPLWIESATVAEVHSWNSACLAIAAAFMLGRLRDLGATATGDETASHPGGAPSATGAIFPAGTVDGDRGLAAKDLRAAGCWGLLCGLCGTHHATALLFVLPMSAALCAAHVRAGRWRASLAFTAVAASLVPLASYAWIPWRAAHPAAFQWPVGPSASALWFHVRGAMYRHNLGHFAPSAEQWSLIRSAALPWTLPGMLLGSVLALRTTSRAVRRGMLALLTGATLEVVFIVTYGVPDPEEYFLPVLMASLLVATPALLWLARRTSPALAMAVGLLPVLGLGAWSVPRALSERAGLAEVDAGFRAAWRKIPFDRGIVLWRDDHYSWFKVLQLLEGQRPGLYVDNPDLLVWRARRTAFQERFGFDPLEGLAFHTMEDVERVPDVIRQHARVPVLVLPEYQEPRPRGP